MPSEHAERFNHDAQALRYDAHVLREDQPIRAGYQSVLEAVAQSAGAHLDTNAVAVDLGAGTGNLTALLPSCARVIAVDVSVGMLARAKSKLGSRPEVAFVTGCALDWLTAAPADSVDCVASTYALHHLDEAEKLRFIAELPRVLRRGGGFVLGDLAFADAAAERAFLDRVEGTELAYLADEVADEFFWDVARARVALDAAGFAVEARQHSELSWSVHATLRTA